MGVSAVEKTVPAGRLQGRPQGHRQRPPLPNLLLGRRDHRRRRASGRQGALLRRPQSRSDLWVGPRRKPLPSRLTQPARPHVHPRRQEHQDHRSGPDRQDRRLPHRTGPGLSRHPDGRRRAPDQGRHELDRLARRNPADLRLGRRSQGRHGRRRLGHLRPAVGRRRRHHRSDRRRNPLHHLHHRRHSGDGHGQGQAPPGRLQVAPPGPELPGHPDAGRVQDRHHAGQHLQEGLGRHRVAFGHPDL